MPFGDFVNQIPAVGFLAIHLTAFLIGAYFAWRSFAAGATLLGWGFSLFALAEISYMTYHLDWTSSCSPTRSARSSISSRSSSSSPPRRSARSSRADASTR